MADDDFPDEPDEEVLAEPEDLDDEVDLDDEEPDLEDDLLVDDFEDDTVEAGAIDEVDDASEITEVPVAVVVPADEEEGDDDDEEVDPDDVEADLDTILKDRLVVVADEEEEDEDEPVDAEDRTGETTKVRPRAPGEFVCQSCFLVKHPSQLADADKQFCRDCV